LTPERHRAWQVYFETGDREPLCRAYEKSIQYIAYDRFRDQYEDMTQVGMMGLLKAIERLDLSRVKSLDAWVFLNVRGMMLNVTRPKPTESLDFMIEQFGEGSFLSLVADDANDVYANDLLDALPDREAFIIRAIHLMKYNRREVGRLLNLSSMRIGQLEQRGLATLRSALI